MPRPTDQILTVAQMRAAEDALIAAGDTVETLMDRAGRGAAEWVWRVSGGRSVTVLCGPGNNGGDGYVIAEAIRQRGGAVRVIAAADPATTAASNAAALYRGDVLTADGEVQGDVFVDCLFGSGLTRPLSGAHQALIARLTASHHHRVAIDVPSGVDADRGLALNPGLPAYDMTVALGAWKLAHVLMPAAATMGAVRLVDIGAGPVAGAARLLGRPQIAPPGADSHKYRRGLLGIVSGEMAGAAVLAATAAQGAGAGYVRLIEVQGAPLPPDLVAVPHSALADPRAAALLIGPGLGRGDYARALLADVLRAGKPAVLDADALMLLTPDDLAGRHSLIATPHEGELAALESAFGLGADGSKADRARALAAQSGMVIVAKGPDTVIAAPDGRVDCAPRAPSWLSVAGTGDVLAGTIASRLATGCDAFCAAGQGVWLHGEAARLCGPAFSAAQLARAIPQALGACL